ncbi:MAG: radical SAM protein [Deltaproteobacteria bacterium]|uniref:Radical SAM protein n=1 Tax=Candidatus Zymogenus saltonus TaxID=2844893 RepID=A0A9D8PPZ2_9DELT|nr:radical SAM protein [Candidatus Zymogenus saltonus]
MKRLKRFIIPIFIPNAGCPHLCVFCDQKEVTGFRSNKVNAKTIYDTVNGYLDTRPDWEDEVELAYFGGSFTSLSMKRQNELLKAGFDLIEKGLVDCLRLSTRPDSISERVLENLLSHGVRTVEIGVQSMVDEILKNANRGHTAEDTIRAVELISKYPLSWIAQMMPGLPGDTEETVLYTGRKVAELKPDGVRIYPTLVVKGTELERLYRAGKYQPASIDDMISILKKLVLLFDGESIPIIRIGLKPSKELEESVISGPYHPSIGALVLESIMYDRMSSAVGELRFIPDPLTIRVNPSRISTAVGNNKINIINLKREYKLKGLKVMQDEKLREGEVAIDGI